MTRPYKIVYSNGMAGMTKSLTKTMIPGFQVDSPRARETWALAQRLGSPGNYFKFQPSDPLIFPRRLILFTRRRASEIGVGDSKSHHHRFVFFTVLKGAARICVDERVFHLEEGASFLIFPFQFHQFLPEIRDPIGLLFITFEMEDAAFLEPLRNRPCAGRESFLFELNHFIPRGNPAPEQTAEATLRLLLMLRELLAQIPGGREMALSSSPSDEGAQIILERVNRFLHRNITQPFKMRELARECGYSASHLRSLFRQHICMTLGQYLSEARLRKATALLHQSTMNITEISEACGYSSLYAFSRIFHQKLGLSPRDYRKKSHES